MTLNLKKLCKTPKNLEKLLEDEELSVNSQVDDKIGANIIHYAVLENSPELVKIVAKFNGNLDALDNTGRTPVAYSLDYQRANILETLLVCGADANKPVVGYASVLHKAATISDATYAHLLLKYGAICEVADHYGDWPLHKALLEENLDAAEELSRHANTKSQVNKHGARGLTPLHIAALEGTLDAFGFLIQCGARLDYLDDRKRTAIDILIQKEDTFGLETIGKLLVDKAMDLKTKSLDKLLKTTEGINFFKTLNTIDNEYQADLAKTEESDEDNSNSNQLLLQTLRNDDKIDLTEFVNVVVKAAKVGLTEDILTSDLLSKIADNVLKHILLPQNEFFLQEIMRCGRLWSKLVDYLEVNHTTVYKKSLSKKKDGIKGLILRTCMSDDNQAVEHEKLHNLIARMTKMWRLQDSEENEKSRQNSLENVENTETSTDKNKTSAEQKVNEYNFNISTKQACVMKDPVTSLVLWSVLTGRLRLVPHLLRQEDHDLIPLALLTATVLRALGNRRDIEDVYSDKACRMADTCEGIAIQALRRVKDIDSSPNNILTMEYVRLPQTSYGDYTILDIAARGGSSKFVTIDVVQECLDSEWYKDFTFVQGQLLSEVTIAMGFIPPLMIFVPKMMQKCRARFPEFMKNENRDSLPDEAPDGLEKKQRYESGNNAENLQLLPTTKIEQPNNIRPSSTSSQRDADGDNQSEPSPIRNFFSDLYTFYQTPCVKFRTHVSCHITFIMLLSYIVISDYNDYISEKEFIVYATLLGFLVEEISEMISSKKEESLMNYFKDGWNLIDLVAIFCGFAAFIIRVEMTPEAKPNPHVLYGSLVLLTTTCLVYWIRLLYVSFVLESLGPKLKMMSLMVKKDFLPFLYILFVLMFGFGVTFQSLLYPNGRSPYEGAKKFTGGEIFFYMFTKTFYSIVGDYGGDEVCPELDMVMNGTEVDVPTGKCIHPIGSTLVKSLFLVVYIVVSQILLLNLIVAMFSKTIDEIDSVSKAMWQFEKYDLIEEFQVRSALPPPFNTISEIRNCIFWLAKKLHKVTSNACQMPDKEGLQKSSNEWKNTQTLLFFYYYMALALRNNRKNLTGVVQDEEDLDEAAKILNSGINSIREKLEKVDRLEGTVKKLESLIGKLQRDRKRGTSHIRPDRNSIINMDYADDDSEHE